MSTVTDVDYGPDRNMYGCLPCPKCKDTHRWPTKRDGQLFVICDDCGLEERGVDKR